jgi:hypothetical protein
MSYNPFGNQYQIGSTNPNPVGSASPLGSTQINTNTTTAPTADKNDLSGLSEILGIGTQLASIGGAIANQRQQSGASARRQSRVATCGRRPLFGRRRKEDYDKCIAEYNASLNAPPIVDSSSDANKSIGGGESGSSMKFVWIGLAVVALGGFGYLAFRKK